MRAPSQEPIGQEPMVSQEPMVRTSAKQVTSEAHTTKRRRVDAETVGLSLFFAIAGVLVTLQVTLEINWRVGAPSHLSPSDFGLLLLMLAAFIVAAGVLSVLPSTVLNDAGDILWHRIVDADQNWREDPLRSFVELFLCASAVWHVFTVSGDLGYSLLCGLLSSWVVVFCGDACTERLRQLESAIGKTFGETQVELAVEPGQRMGCSLTLLALYVWSGLQLIYAHVHDLLLASLLAALMCMTTLVLARACTACSPLRKLGELLQDRLLFSARANWSSQPMRCAVEVCISLGSALHAFGTGLGLLAALQLGVLSGVLTCLLSEGVDAMLERALARELERALTHEPTPELLLALFGSPGVGGGAARSGGASRAAVGAVATAGVVAGVLAANSHFSEPPSSDVAMRLPPDLSPSRIRHPERAGLLPPSYTAAIRTEFLRQDKLPVRLAFPMLRIRTTGALATAADLTPTLALMHDALDLGNPLCALFDLRDTGSGAGRGASPKLQPPPVGLVWQVAKWAAAHARPWDTHAQAIAIVLAPDGAAKPLLQVAIRITNPPQPMLITSDEDAALAFLAKHQTVLTRTKG